MKDFRLLLASLLIACLVWGMHTFSLDYSASVPCTVRVVTNLPGYAADAVAQEPLSLRGKATGFYLLKARGTGRRPLQFTLAVDARHFHPVEGEEDTFQLLVSELREKLLEQLGERFVLDFLEPDQLTFVFTPQSFVRVPVEAAFDLSFRNQYMQVGEIRLKPDSVQVYGPVKELQRVTGVRTRDVSRTGVDKSLQGYVELEGISGLRLDTERVWYEVEVDRYVESTVTLPVTVRDAPPDHPLMVLPSKVEVTYRAPFRPRGGRIGAEDLSLVVDYADYLHSGSAKVIPRLETVRDVYAWRLKPELVECLQVEAR